MPYEELKKWLIFFDKRPIGWRDDTRFSTILKAIGVKAKPEQIFPSLGKIKASESNQSDGSFNVNSFRKSSLFQKLLTAKNGDKVDILK